MIVPTTLSHLPGEAPVPRLKPEKRLVSEAYEQDITEGHETGVIPLTGEPFHTLGAAAWS